LCALAAGAEIAALPPTGSPAKFSLEECRRGDAFFGDLVRQFALRHGVEPRALAVRTLLHLPRVAGHNGRVTRRQLETELRNRAVDLRADQARVQELIPSDAYPLQDLRFAEYDAHEAAAIFSHLHYLRSARAGSRNFALLDPVHGRPVTLCSVSPLEWAAVGKQLQKQFGVPMARMWDVSRVYSFDVAPSNAISTLLSKVRTVMRQSGGSVELLTTAVDPNLGFTGSSYRAANWQQWLSIRPRPYLYVDARYMSPRQLRSTFGTANLAEVRIGSGALVEQSRTRLLDSAMFCCRLRGETEYVAPEERHRLRR